MDNYMGFKKQKEKDFDLGYGMVFINSGDKMNDFMDKQVAKMLLGPDPGCEPIILDQIEKQFYCFQCNKLMLKRGNVFECSRCGNCYIE